MCLPYVDRYTYNTNAKSFIFLLFMQHQIFQYRKTNTEAAYPK